MYATHKCLKIKVKTFWPAKLLLMECGGATLKKNMDSLYETLLIMLKNMRKNYMIACLEKGLVWTYANHIFQI